MFVLGGILLGVVIMMVVITIVFVAVYFLKKEPLTTPTRPLTLRRTTRLASH